MKVVLTGLNYINHARELGMDLPEHPIIFLKPSTAVIGPGEPIVLPEGVGRVDYEGEIAVVIGRRCKAISEEEVPKVLRGIVALNDVTARDVQRLDGQWTRAKSYDTFCPISAEMIEEFDLNQLIEVETRVNGELRQSGSSENMIFSIPYLVSFIPQVMTLEEGDVIATGTPPGIGPLRRGDEVKVSVIHKGRRVEVVNPVV